MRDIIEFKIEESNSNFVDTTFMLEGTNLTALCNCAKGGLGKYCVHTLRILMGETTGIVSNNIDQVSTARAWLKNTDVGAALAELAKAELQLDTAKENVENAKENVAQALRD